MHTQSFTISPFPKIGLTHKNVSPVESPTVATYPFAGERGETHRCVFQRRKMRGVATNVYLWKTSEKTEGNRSWRIFQIRELYLRLRKVLAPLTFVPKSNSLKLELCEIVYLNFIYFFIFEVDKSGALAPTYPPSKRKSDLRSSFLRVNQAISFTWNVVFLRRWTLTMIHFYLVRKSEVLNLKILFSDFLRSSLTLRVDFSLSFTLVISQFN